MLGKETGDLNLAGAMTQKTMPVLTIRLCVTSPRAYPGGVTVCDCSQETPHGTGPPRGKDGYRCRSCRLLAALP